MESISKTARHEVLLMVVIWEVVGVVAKSMCSESRCLGSSQDATRYLCNFEWMTLLGLSFFTCKWGR